MKPETWILVLAFIHLMADFVFQSDAVAKGKSKSIATLTRHIIEYTAVFAFFILSLWYLYPEYFIKTGWDGIPQFLGLTAILHMLTDFFTSQLNTYLWEKKKTHSFFVGVGTDQYIHLFCLIYAAQIYLI